MSAIPNHVAVIPNGNRRKSRALGMSLDLAYVRGAHRALRTSRWAKDAGVRHVSFFGLSVENFANRPESQIDALMKGAIRFLDLAGTIGRVHAFGDIDKFKGEKKYEPLYERLRLLNGTQHEQEQFTMHVGTLYSGKPEHELGPLMAALRSRGFADVCQDIPRYLMSGGVPNVDLLIRTGGEHRTSGFLPFQSAYAELYFTNVLWSDFSQDEFNKALEWFAQQPRNFGK